MVRTHGRLCQSLAGLMTSEMGTESWSDERKGYRTTSPSPQALEAGVGICR
jgi:hypothetical protein